MNMNMNITEDLLDHAKTCIYLKIYKVPDLAINLSIDYLDLKSTLMSELGEKEYISVTKGSTSAMGRARRESKFRKKIIISDDNLIETLELMLMKGYTVYDLSNLLDVEIDDLLNRSIEVIERVRYFRKIDMSKIVEFQNATRDQVLKTSSRKEFERSWLVRQWETEEFLLEVLKDGFDVRKLILNSWEKKNFSDIKIRSLVERSKKAKAKELLKTSSSIQSLEFDYENIKNSEFDESAIVALFQDRFSLDEISSISNKRVSEIKSLLSSIGLSRSKLRRIDSDRVYELHLDRCRKMIPSNLNELVREGRLTLEDVCKILILPKMYSDRLTKSGVINASDLKKGCSCYAARNCKSSNSNSSALDNILQSHEFSEILAKEINSEFRAENLYQISRLRQVKDRKEIVTKLIERIEDSKYCKPGFSNLLIDALQIDLTIADQIEFNRRYRSYIFESEDEFFSSYERKVLDYLDSLGIKYSVHDRKIFKYDYEIDILIEDLKLGIEISPIASHHSNVVNDRFFEPKGKEYHYRKYRYARDLGYELITLYEYDLSDENFEKFVKPMLVKRLDSQDEIRRIYARDTRFEEIVEEDARQFLEDNRLDGYANSFKNFCLKDDHNEIVAVISINKITEDRYEISQISERSDVLIVDMISKFSYCIFKVLSRLNILIAFSDNDKSTGEEYRSSRFKFVNETGPRRMYLSKSDPCNDRYIDSVSEVSESENEILSILLSQLSRSSRSSRSSPFRRSKDLEDLDTERYVETSLSHKTDNGEGYDRLYTSGFKKWKIERSDLF